MAIGRMELPPPVDGGFDFSQGHFHGRILHQWRWIPGESGVLLVESGKPRKKTSPSIHAGFQPLSAENPHRI
jgi:hypothetical protein